jgi:tRNA pseudouridine13 synthase
MSKRAIPSSPVENKRPRITDQPPEQFVVDEKDFGITEYLSRTQPFQGIIKHKFNDFHVHELVRDEESPLGSSILHLQVLKSEKAPVPETNPIENVKIVADMLSMEEVVLKELLNGTREQWESPPIDDKHLRKSFHTAIRDYFGKFLETSTKENSIVIRKCVGKSNQLRGWGGLEYCHFTLYKENRDTMDALNLIANYLHVQSKVFSFAGSTFLTQVPRTEEQLLFKGYLPIK